MDKHKYVIIYLPNGTELEYSTKEMLGGVIKVDALECNPLEVKIAYKEDGKIKGKSYVNIPYILELF